VEGTALVGVTQAGEHISAGDILVEIWTDVFTCGNSFLNGWCAERDSRSYWNNRRIAPFASQLAMAPSRRT